ncbi:MAG: tryptophan-rich sensory protein [Anaerolineales bacterium]|nr:tryptophan-rich sensory protein [Anaerolineales bacterium]MDW8277480.1 TspO/MBR family protein [Anaerolineales bacterium]
MRNDTIRPMVNVLSVAATIVMNILANALPFNGQNTGEISDRFQVFFVPAGYVFSIWGLIYIGWIAFAVYQALPAQRANPRLQKLGYWFALSGVFNSLWLLCWHYNLFGLSVLVMLALLATLIVSYLRLDVGRAVVSPAERWCVDTPFSIYLGWITVATVANVTDWLYFVQWSGWGIAAPTWAVIMLVVASLPGLLMALTRRDAGYLFVLVWSFAGIGVKQSAFPVVATSAWAASALAFGLAVFSLLLRRAQ